MGRREGVDVLENSWRPDTPHDDTLFRAFCEDWLQMTATFAKHAGAKFESNATFAGTDFTKPALFFNNVSAMSQPPTEAALDAVDEFFANGTGEAYYGTALGVDVSHRGWKLKEVMPFMVALPGMAKLLPCPSGVTVREWHTSEDVRAVEAMWCESFPFPGSGNFEPNTVLTDGLLDDPLLKTWIATVDGEIAACTTSSIGTAVNNVSIVATRPAFRGRGIASHLVGIASTYQPALPAVLMASEEGKRVYERIGFTAMFELINWTKQR